MPAWRAAARRRGLAGGAPTPSRRQSTPVAVALPAPSSIVYPLMDGNLDDALGGRAFPISGEVVDLDAATLLRTAAGVGSAPPHPPRPLMCPQKPTKARVPGLSLSHTHTCTRTRAHPERGRGETPSGGRAATAFLHEKGFVHRDIKAANVLLRGGHARLSDAGIARALAQGGRLLTGHPPLARSRRHYRAANGQSAARPSGNVWGFFLPAA